MYHKIRYGDKNQEAKKNKPKGGKFKLFIIFNYTGWDEDDKDYSIKSSSSKYSTPSNYQRPTMGTADVNVEKLNTNYNSSYNYKQKDVQAKATISM